MLDLLRGKHESCNVLCTMYLAPLKGLVATKFYGHCFFVCVVVVLGVWGAGRYKSISKLEKENSVSVAGEVDCPFGRFQTCLPAAGCVQQWPDCLRSLGALWTRPRCTNPALNVKVARQAKWVVLQTPLFLQTSRAIHWLSWSSSVRIACVQT